MALTLDDLSMILKGLKDLTEYPAAHTLRNNTASIWIASGLAKISAAYGAALIEQSVGLPSQLMSPMDYCQKPLLRALPVLVSLKGQHEDAIDVAQSIVNRSSSTSVLITGEPEGPTAQKLSKGSSCLNIVSTTLPQRDRRFVNCRSIFMLSTLAYQLVKQAFGGNAVNDIDECSLSQAFYRAREGANSIVQGIAEVENWRFKQLIILGQGVNSELALPWQSIFAEAGIATVTCTDLKDYTHGDHLAAVCTKNAIFLVIQHPGIEDMVRIFVSRFETRFPVLVVPLESLGPTRFWESLFYSCNTADELTHLLGYGGQRPPKDDVVHSWRGWGRLN